MWVAAEGFCPDRSSLADTLCCNIDLKAEYCCIHLFHKVVYLVASPPSGASPPRFYKVCRHCWSMLVALRLVHWKEVDVVLVEQIWREGRGRHARWWTDVVPHTRDMSVYRWLVTDGRRYHLRMRMGSYSVVCKVCSRGGRLLRTVSSADICEGPGRLCCVCIVFELELEGSSSVSASRMSSEEVLASKTMRQRSSSSVDTVEAE